MTAQCTCGHVASNNRGPPNLEHATNVAFYVLSIASDPCHITENIEARVITALITGVARRSGRQRWTVLTCWPTVIDDV